MAIGNTFGATALSSYGGFWISFAIILTPGGFHILEGIAAGGPKAINDSLGFYLLVTIIHHIFKEYIVSDAKNLGMVHFYLPPLPLYA